MGAAAGCPWDARWGLGKGKGSTRAAHVAESQLEGFEAGPERSSECVRLTFCPRCHHSLSRANPPGMAFGFAVVA